MHMSRAPLLSPKMFCRKWLSGDGVCSHLLKRPLVQLLHWFSRVHENPSAPLVHIQLLHQHQTHVADN